jgi:hypothetical protein
LRKGAKSRKNQGVQKEVLLGGLLGILVAALTAGCGDGEAVSKEQYVSELNAMCEDFSAKEKDIGDPQTLTDLVEKGPRILDAFEKMIVDKVGKLKAPDEIADRADRLVDLTDQQRNVIAGLVDAAEANDVAKVRELDSKNKALNKETTSITRELGANVCADEN